MNQFNNSTKNHENENPDNAVKCRYFYIVEIQTRKISKKIKSLSLFHTHTNSLSKIFDDLENLHKTKNINFDIIAISENKITEKINLTSNNNFRNYAFE